MTYRTALFLAAGTAAFMSATPTLAGSSNVTYLPSLHFAPEAETVTRASRAPFPVCTQLEKSARVDPAHCGTYSRAELAQIIASQDK